jgi:hypothetical protein
MSNNLYIPITTEVESLNFVLSLISNINSIKYYYLIDSNASNILENYLVFSDGEKECIISINEISQYEIEEPMYPFMVDLKDNNGKDLTLVISYLFCNYFGYILYNDCGVLGSKDCFSPSELLNLVQLTDYYQLIKEKLPNPN